MRRIAGRHVLVDECRRVNVVDHEIELAVVIQIRVGRTIGKSRLVDSPAPAFVGEGHVAVVAEDIARFGVRWQVPQKSQCAPRVTALPRAIGGVHVVQIVDRFRIAVADEDVLVTVVVEVSEERAPAPVGVRDPGQTRDLAEYRTAVAADSVAQLQRVLGVIVTKTATAVIGQISVGHEAAHPLPTRQVSRHHVDLQDVGPAIVVEIGGIDTHSRLTGVLQPCSRFVGERPIAVVDVHDVVGNTVVGDVDVGPAISVQIGDDDTESVPSIPQNAGVIRDIREMSVTVIVIKLVVTAGSGGQANRAVTAAQYRFSLL